MQTDAPYVLLYDGDCCICSAFARVVTLLSRRRLIHARPIQASRALLGGMSEEAALGSAHLASPDGRIRNGPDVLPAIAGVLLACPDLEDRVNASLRARATTHHAYRLLVSLRGSLSCASGAPSSAARTLR